MAPVTPPGRLRLAAATGVGEAGGLRAATVDGGPPRATVCRRCHLSTGTSSGVWRGAVVVARTSAWRAQSMVPLIDLLFFFSTAPFTWALRPRCARFWFQNRNQMAGSTLKWEPKKNSK